MSRRSFTLALSSALMLVMALAAAGPAQAASSKAQEKAERARVVKYWTPGRMANAIPRDFVKKDGKFVPAGKGGTRGKPPKDGGGGEEVGGGTNVVTGASWTAKDKGLYATGKVFFTLGTTNYVCSGSVVADGRPDYSTVLTAGHCAYDETNGRWARNFIYVPAYDEAPVSCSSSDCHVASALVVHEGFADAGGFNRQAIQHDWAFAVFPDGTPAGQLDDGGRSFGISFTGPSSGDTRQSFGYPAAGKYNGSDLVYCVGPVSPDSNYGTWGLACDMTGGASGGPWIGDYGTSGAELNSVNSYKYNGGPLKNYMFGPDFNGKTEKTFNVARDATSDNTEATGTAN